MIPGISGFHTDMLVIVRIIFIYDIFQEKCKENNHPAIIVHYHCNSKDFYMGTHLKMALPGGFTKI